MACDHSSCGYTWPNVRVGELPVRGEGEPADHFADRMSFFYKAKSARFGGDVVVGEMRKQGDREARDMAAYKSLREQGYQPPTVDGAHDRMMYAKGDYDVDVAARVNKDREILAEKGLEFTR